MSEVVETSGNTAGALLRTAREAAGLHIEALAVALKVPVSKLQALESDQHAELLDTVFVRALASSVCRVLKVDAAPVLALLPQSLSPNLDADSAGLNAPVKAYVGKSSMSSSSGFPGGASKSVSVVVVVLLVGALAMLFLPRQQAAESAQPVQADSAPVSVAPAVAVDASNASAAVSGAQGPAVAPAVVVEAVPATATALAAGNSPAPAVASSGLATAAQGALLAPVAAPAPVVPAVEGSAPVAAPAAAGVLVLRARGESWVQVRDASGATVLQRSLPAGESVSVTGTMPLAVVVGRVDATEVFVRGKAFDLSAVSRENVARFEVK